MKERISEKCEYLKDLLLRKNADYGNSAFKPATLLPALSPVTSNLVRMSDKIARITNLVSNVESMPAVEESLNDSYMDLAGYCILMVIYNELTEEERNNLL